MLPPHLAIRFWPTWIGIGLLRLVVLLPYTPALRIGNAAGQLIYALLPARKKRVADVNLQICFPEMPSEERRSMAKRHAGHMGMGGIEAAMSWWWPDRKLQALGTIEGLENVLEPLRQGRGVILLSAHFSMLEIAGQLMAMALPGATVVYRRSENAAFEYVIRKGRERHTEQVIHRDDARAILRSLRHGQVVWYAPDQNYRNPNRVFAPFFGIAAATNPATSRLAAKTGAAVVPFSTIRLPDNTGYLIRVEKALEGFPGTDMTTDATRINAVFERWVRDQPADYFWFHRRFRTRPKGEPKLYA